MYHHFMSVELKKLPWEENSLEPIISAKTIFHHYHKHHAGYVKKLNSLLIDEKKEDMDLKQIMDEFANKDGVGKVIWNNAAQHFNHEFYWDSMIPVGTQQIDSKISTLIDSSFNDMAGFKEQFFTACTTLFGSGWVWLTYNGEKLLIEKTSNADMPSHHPLLVMDVWEHAYYLDYQQDRGEHVKALLNLLNWDKAAERLDVKN